jgi:hypothetical protein
VIRSVDQWKTVFQCEHKVKMGVSNHMEERPGLTLAVLLTDLRLDIFAAREEAFLACIRIL